MESTDKLIKVKDALKIYEIENDLIIELGDFSLKFRSDVELPISDIANVIELLTDKYTKTKTNYLNFLIQVSEFK